VRRLFFAVLLWFWTALVAVAVSIVLVVLRAGWGHRSIVRLTLHDLLVFSVAGAIFCFFLSRHLTDPLRKLGEAAARIAEGRLDTRVDCSLFRRRDEIADLARNFDRMAERIELLVVSQRQLLGDVSHELRSPLSRLTVALGLVKVGPPEEAAENLDRIGLEAARLDALISQLLALTRIGSGVDRERPMPVDLAALVQEVASDGDFEARARNRSVVITRAADCRVEGHEELLRSAVENVLRNAIRHTREGTSVEVSLKGSEGRAVISVRDHGSGVPEEKLATIFRPFHRSPDSDGAGLGLTIAERAVSVQGGSIRAANAGDGGLVVEIELPATGFHLPD
jgi:two-component system sensor histidine kinase CpxA